MSSTPPRRPPLGPWFNRWGGPAASKPAPGKENIAPRRLFIVPGLRTITAATTATTAAATTTNTTATTTTTIVATTTAIAATNTPTDLVQAEQTPAPAILPSNLPPWRLPGAFDADESDAPTASNDDDENSGVTKKINDDSADVSDSESCTHDQELADKSPAGGVAPVENNAEEARAKASEEETAIELAALCMIPRELPTGVKDLEEDPELDYGDEFHDLP